MPEDNIPLIIESFNKFNDLDRINATEIRESITILKTLADELIKDPSLLYGPDSAKTVSKIFWIKDGPTILSTIVSKKLSHEKGIHSLEKLSLSYILKNLENLSEEAPESTLINLFDDDDQEGKSEGKSEGKLEGKLEEKPKSPSGSPSATRNSNKRLGSSIQNPLQKRK